MRELHGRVVILVLDGFGPEFVRPDLTPTMVRLASSGTLAPVGGLADLVASTGPGHATLLTGTRGTVHGVLANRVLDADGVPTSAVSVSVPTIVDRARGAGCSTAMVVSDPDIITTVHGARADFCWPGGDEARRLADPRTGYVPDERTLETLIGRIDAGCDLIVGQLQETDTAAHGDGIDGERAMEAYRTADRAVGQVAAALARDWERTLLLVVSDHRAENVVSAEPVTLGVELDGQATVIEDGSAALIWPTQPDLAAMLRRALNCPGVAALTPTDGPYYVAWAEPGRAFGRERPILSRSTHGNVTTRPCLTLLAGGHPAVATLGPAIRRSPPPLWIWANVVAQVIGT